MICLEMCIHLFMTRVISFVSGVFCFSKGDFRCLENIEEHTYQADKQVEVANKQLDQALTYQVNC